LPLGVPFLRVQTPGYLPSVSFGLLTRPVAYAMQLPPDGEAQSKERASVVPRGCLIGGVRVKLIRRGEQQNSLNNPRPAISRDHYYFYEKSTGATHFHVEAGPDGCFPVDQAAGLLAMHCMVRGQSPNDYIVMVKAESDLLEGLKEKAEKLLQAGHSVRSAVKLTRREEEVLGGVMKSLANKEIAATLNLSERTVKFHVSSLLAKFRVRGRMELVREASRSTVASMPMPLAIGTREARSYAPPMPQKYNNGSRSAAVVPLAAKRELMA
jgi:DNA-binding CsgD family transcriptional regulator